MVNSILNAVTKQLGTTFGMSYKYYVENVEQGLTKPCFTVDILTAVNRSKSPVLYDRTMPIVVHFFSDSKEVLKNKCFDMGEKVIECLEYLPFKGVVLRGEDMSYQMVEDVLQVFITYKFTTINKTDDSDPMTEYVETVTHAQ